MSLPGLRTFYQTLRKQILISNTKFKGTLEAKLLWDNGNNFKIMILELFG